jgi:hyperosmotically inducible periplasmic protein
MNRKLATTALIIGALALPIAGYAADDKKPESAATTWVKDSVITAKVKAEFMKDPAVGAMAIKVDTDDKGMVQLSGTAKSQAEVDKAVKIARATEGVTNVKNEIKVAP